ncbi:NACHT domain protein [Fusarium tjaetaba]|uniref:NACHT domain protein n=1 Tax=Fusarium tjaetaba TaxID=1567544 RepID=A0A8H5W5F1_9HYPO|nr:NACHT domain protein [Fusarium tjaetaba]KAF5645963.1 NACHT domain protein [Fusarium tjaetaba]
MDRKGPIGREPYEIFREACHEFRSSLTEKDKALFKEFSDAKSMLATITEDAKSHPVHSSTLTRCCKGINSIANRLSPFFDIASLFVSSHPEFAALAWGSIRLVFVLGSNHAKFLERVCGMFENMSMLLPAYEEYASRLRSRLTANGHEGSNRIFKTLAYIYADLIQFCFEMCKLFTRKRSRLLMLHSSFSYSTVWRPFDIRYDDLLQRWKDHREIFELEMSITANIQQFETGDRVGELLKRVDGDWGAKSTYTRDLKELDIDYLLIRLKSWIDPPAWAYAFENSQHKRSERTTEWFLEHYKVSRWLSQVAPERTISALSVQGKPGYGKTTLCATLIEYIQTCYTSYSTYDSVAVVYFFFDRQRQANSTAMAALRAILAQLLHIFRKDEAILDIITLLWDQNKTGQVTASGSEIISALCLLSSRISKLFMAVDGVDECQDHEDLFDYLKEICRHTDSVSVAIFSRPNLAIPQDLSSMLQHLDLTSTMNFESLETFLQPRIYRLARDGVISSEENRDQVVKLLASRANGMFLWARLLGLDALYQEMLRSIEQRTWQAARLNITRAFQFVSYAPRPLHVNELEVAITTPLSSAVDEYDTIPNFEKALSKMSGALIELDSERKARFVHVSVLEYLTDQFRQDQSLDSVSQLVKERFLAQRSCASCCLAYLLYSIPAEPLGGGPQVIADRGLQKLRYPFLEYSAQYWDYHFSEFLLKLPQVLSQECELAIKLASDFVSAKRTLMAWIEACCIFGEVPRILSNWPQQADGSPSAVRIPISMSENTVSNLEDTVKRLHQLTLELADLKKAWQDILLESPFEIWEPSIEAFHNTSLWESVPGSEIVARLSNSDSGIINPICLKSLVSPDGKRLGVIRLSTDSRVHRDDIDWKITFEEWSVNPFEKVFEADIALTNLSLAPFIESMKCIDKGNDHRFLFELPLAITPDLSRIVAPGCVTTINRNSESLLARKKSPHIQLLNFTLTPGPMGNMPFKFPVRQLKDTYALFISDSKEFIMTIHQSKELIDIYETWSSKLWVATVYRRSQERAGRIIQLSLFILTILQALRLWASIDRRVNIATSLSPTCSNFHRLDHVILWGFSATGNDVLDSVRREHTRIEFPEDGAFFYGKRLVPHGSTQKQGIVTTREESKRRAFDSSMAATSNSSVQSLNTIMRATDASGFQVLSSLEKAGAGAIIRQTLREDGFMVRQEISKLPKSLFNIADPTIIPQERNVVQVVVNRASRVFEPYEFHIGQTNTASVSSSAGLPLVLERQEETIPTYIGTGSYSLENGMNFKGEKRGLEGRLDEGKAHKRRLL